MPGNPFLTTVQNVQANRASLQLARQHMQGMPDDMVADEVAATASVANVTGRSMQDVGQRINQSARMAQQHGLDRSFGLRVGQSNAAFATAFGQEREQHGGLGFGGLTQQRAGRLDQELRLAAARSPVANAMGAVHAMVEAGVLDQDVIGGIDYSRGPAGVMQQLKDRGVDTRVAGQFMASTQANQEQIQKHGLQDQVRLMQQQEVAGLLGRDIENNLMGGFRQQGMDRQGARAAARDTSMKMTQELLRLAQEDPSKLNNLGELTEAMSAVAPGVDRQQVAGAVQALRNRVMSDPNMRKFGNLQGLLVMNAGAAQVADEMAAEGRGGAENVRQAHQRAERDRTQRMTQLRKDLGIAEGASGQALMTALQQQEETINKMPDNVAGADMTAMKQQRLQQIQQLRQLEEAGNVDRGPAAAANRNPDGDDGGGGGMGGRITGTLTLLDGGQGQLEAQAQGAAPGGE